MVQAPQGQFSRLDVAIEQGGKSYPVFSTRSTDAGNNEPGRGRSLLRHAADRQARDPRPAAGPRAHRRARRAAGDARTAPASNPRPTRDVQVRLEPPQASVLSTFHYVNLGGAEFVVYRATPADVESGVRVGDRTYPGFPATAVGVKSDPAAARRVLRAVVRPGREHADRVFATRSRGQHRHRGPRSHGVHASRSHAARSRSTAG